MIIESATNIRKLPISDVEIQQHRISEMAYQKAKKRGFWPGHELKDWLEAESEVMWSSASRDPR